MHSTQGESTVVARVSAHRSKFLRDVHAGEVVPAGDEGRVSLAVDKDSVREEIDLPSVPRNPYVEGVPDIDRNVRVDAALESNGADESFSRDP